MESDGANGRATGAPRHAWSFAAMGSVCALHLYAGTPALAQAAATAILDEIERIEARYSRYRPDSLLSAINRVAAEGGSLDLDTETAGLIDYAFACHALSGGAFDITAGILRRAWDFDAATPPDPAVVAALLPRIGLPKLRWEGGRLGFPQAGQELDLGGIGKEYAADRAAEVALAHGIEHGLVDLGGDIRVIGPHPDGTPWRIAIRDPRHPAGFFLQDDPSQAPMIAWLSLAGGGLASSGDYERRVEHQGRRYGHILDPRDGWPVQGLRAVSVVADRCLVAGSLATIAMLKGRAGAAWLDGLAAEHLWMDEEGRRHATAPGFTLTPEC